jgi:hypothetical protein
MRPLYCILIETDPKNSLGGSCIRDLYNTANYLIVNEYLQDIFVFTTNEISNKNKFPNITKFDILSNFKKQLNDRLNMIPNNSTLLVMISGHGYQKNDSNNDELDGMDEYVKTKNEFIIDDDLWEIFIKNMDKSINFVGICDTCHSGSMFDLDYSWNGNEWMEDSKRDKIKRNAISIGACKDNQLENCDIGESIGFGGALTIQLIENNLLNNLIDCDNKKLIGVYNTISKNLKVFNQEPVIQTNIIN